VVRSAGQFDARLREGANDGHVVVGVGLLDSPRAVTVGGALNDLVAGLYVRDRHHPFPADVGPSVLG
jgi:hypothetical protein